MGLAEKLSGAPRRIRDSITSLFTGSPESWAHAEERERAKQIRATKREILNTKDRIAYLKIFGVKRQSAKIPLVLRRYYARQDIKTAIDTSRSLLARKRKLERGDESVLSTM